MDLTVLARQLWGADLPERKRLLEPFFSALKDRKPAARKEAAAILAQLGDILAIDPLLETLKDLDQNVKEAAFNALCELNHHAASGLIYNRLEDVSGAVKIKIFRILKQRGWQPSNQSEHAAFIITTTDWSTLEPPDQQQMVLLLHALDHRDRDIASTASKALDTLTRPGSVDILLSILERDDGGEGIVRLKAIEMLGIIGDAKAMAPLAQTELSPVWNFYMDRETIKLINFAIHRAIHRIKKHNQQLDIPCLCRNCFRYFAEFKLDSGVFRDSSYYACPSCLSSSFVMGGFKKLILLLDKSREEKEYRDGDTLTLNWYSLKRVVDFDEICIKNADDFDIEELLLKFSNEMDASRRQRLQQVPVSISPGVKLSTSKLNLLKSLFQHITGLE